MLEDGAEVLDADDDVKLVLDFDVIKLVHLDRNISVEGLFENSWYSSAQAPLKEKRTRDATFVADSAALLHLLRKACEVHNPGLIVGVDVEKLYARAEVVHQLPQCPGRNGPLVSSFVFIEFGVGRRFHLVWQRV